MELVEPRTMRGEVLHELRDSGGSYVVKRDGFHESISLWTFTLRFDATV